MPIDNQNGCQPPVPQQTAPPTDPRIRNVSSAGQQSKICRDFVWGICTKGKQCKFRHELDVEAMKSILKFCHDYQNRTGCTRPDCTYLHSTREEQNLFLTTGQIPRALIERHAKMSSSPLNMYVNEYIAQAPPPPPPPPPSTTVPPPPLPAPLPTLLAPPPPPPPPPPPTTSNAPVQMTAPIFSAPPPFSSSTIFTATQPPPPLPPMFDASRPPPPIPSNSISHKNGTMKRAIAEPAHAGPSKARKVEGSKVVDSLCENCVQRELRIQLYRRELQKLECEKEYQTYRYEKKSEEYENGRLFLKSVASPELFYIMDEYIEGSSQLVQVNDVLAQVNDSLTQYNQTSSFVSGSSTVPRQFLLQLMDCVFSNPRTLVDSTPISSVGVDETSILHSLTALTRRSNPINHTSTDVLQALLEVIRNSAPLNSDNDRPSTSHITSNAVNGFSHFINGQKVESVAPAVVAGSSQTSIPNVSVRTYPTAPANAAVTSHTPQPSASHPPTTLHFSSALQIATTSHPSGAPQTPSTPHPPVTPRLPVAPRPPVTHPPTNALPPNVSRPPNMPHASSVRPMGAHPAYLPYQPAVPPPTNRPYYPQTYTTASNYAHSINAPYPNTPVRSGVTPQITVRPSTSVTAPPAQTTQNYNPYVMGRYPPQPHYYPPFQ